MRIQTRERPTGQTLFRTCWIACLVAALFGGLALLSCWSATGFDPADGRDFGYLLLLLFTTLGWGILMHFPWGPNWVRANGCRTDDPAI